MLMQVAAVRRVVQKVQIEAAEVEEAVAAREKEDRSERHQREIWAAAARFRVPCVCV
jgi:hypothetical protein